MTTWHYDHDGWHGFVPDGQGYWMETDGYGTYWSTEDALWEELSPEENKELDEAFAAYETKARTFLQSRQLQRAKGKSRGFYPKEQRKRERQEGQKLWDYNLQFLYVHVGVYTNFCCARKAM